MSEAKDPKSEAREAKTQVEKLVTEFGAQDMGTYMDARVEGEALRVAVWNENLKSFQPTEDGLKLLAGPTPKEKAKEREKEKDKDKPGTKPATSSQPTQPPPTQPTQPTQQPVPPPPPPGTRPPTG